MHMVRYVSKTPSHRNDHQGRRVGQDIGIAADPINPWDIQSSVRTE
jgi:hypothetical protein